MGTVFKKGSRTTAKVQGLETSRVHELWNVPCKDRLDALASLKCKCSSRNLRGSHGSPNAVEGAQICQRKGLGKNFFSKSVVNPWKKPSTMMASSSTLGLFEGKLGHCREFIFSGSVWENLTLCDLLRLYVLCLSI
ncbi:hypothetical protein AHF37_04676 [Paragonimus kellicotti]|nr:hypothetical protein AHF37_04676 [Paragonimus kellicotti]